MKKALHFYGPNPISNRMKILQPLLVAVSLAGCVLSVRAETDAFAECKRLGRSVNIIGYDPIWRSFDQGRFKARHFQLLKEAGFDSVRINLHPFHSLEAVSGGWKLKENWLATLDWAVTNAHAQKLVAILDLHEFTALGNAPEENKAKFLGFWRLIAERYQNAPDDVYFEILNEPSRKLTPALWNEYLREALAIIRAKNPVRPVIVGPAFWNSIDHLKELELPQADRHLIVTVHYYLPMTFTHQGASWTDRPFPTGVEWGSAEEVTAVGNNFDKAADWSRQNNRPIFLGEFGAYDKAPMDSRVRYVAAVARAAEQRGWSWAYWQFDSNFILYDIDKSQWTEPILRALIPAKATPR